MYCSLAITKPVLGDHVSYVLPTIVLYFDLVTISCHLSLTHMKAFHLVYHVVKFLGQKRDHTKSQHILTELIELLLCSWVRVYSIRQQKKK